MSAHSASIPFGKKKGMTVYPRKNKDGTTNIDDGIIALRRRMQTERWVQDVKKHAYYESKGQKRRRRLQEAVKRQKKIRREMEVL